MKLPNLIRAVLEKAAPVDPADLQDLYKKSAIWYDENLKEMEEKELHGKELTLKDKVFKHLDSWYVRIGLAISYFWILRMIQDAMNPGDTEPDPNDMPR